MPSMLFQILKMLDRERANYRIERSRPDTVRIDVHFVGARVEIDVFEDDHIEVSKFVGNEDVESGDAAIVTALLKQYS